MQLGANTFQVQKFPAFNTGPDDRRRFRNRKDITIEQANLVQERATLAEAVGIEIWSFGKVFVWHGQKTNPNLSDRRREPRRAGHQRLDARGRALLLAAGYGRGAEGDDPRTGRGGEALPPEHQPGGRRDTR